MKIVCIGGGPFGLYFSILMKKADPSHQITVYERNRLDDTFGWGVVFSDETLGGFEAADAESMAEVRRNFAYWSDIDVFFKGEKIRSTGHGFCGLARVKLLQILEARAVKLGTKVEHLVEVTDLARFKDADLIVACDGVNSRVRDMYAQTFKPSLDWRKCKFCWLGLSRKLPAFTFIFKENEHGLFQVHAYPFDDKTSTFIVECREEVWKKAGLDKADEAATVAYMEKLFAEDLQGARLLTNRSLWRTFPTIRNERWHHENVVLLGDAVHTAHFSIGSGTKLAMEDAIELAKCLRELKGKPVPEILAEYEKRRRPEVERLQKTAQTSLEWFENTQRYMGMTPLQLTFSLMTRSKSITYDNLRLRDPELVRRVTEEWTSGAGVSPAGLRASRPQEIGKHNRGYLPHWKKDGATYFVTFRLADALSSGELSALEAELRKLEKQLKAIGNPKNTQDLARQIASAKAERIEQLLDNGHGQCLFKDGQCAEIVANAIKHFDGARYSLHAWCVMPNHVHVVLTPMTGHELSEIIHSWKSFSAKECNRVLGRSGTFWQSEAYDHIVRDEGEFARGIAYVLSNPVKAGLKEWPWVGDSSGQDARTPAGKMPAPPTTDAPPDVKPVSDRLKKVSNTGADVPPPVFTPFTLRGCTLPNRVVVSPMCMYSYNDGMPSDWTLVHLGSRAIGGAGLIIAEATAVAPEGRITPGCAGIWRDELVPAWKRVVDFVHTHSTGKIGLQIGHAGRKASCDLPWKGGKPLKEGAWPTVAASAIAYDSGYPVPREMTHDDIKKLRADFVAAASRAHSAGFDWLELHYAHGYLLNSFISALSNQRSDEYGGSLEKRMRLPLEILRDVRGVWPEERPISVRLSTTEWAEGGLSDADRVYIAQALIENGADIIDCSAGGVVPQQKPVYGRMFQVPFSDQIRNEAGVPTMAVGNIQNADQCNTILAAGRADLCVMARVHLADPYLTLHAAEHYDVDVPWPNQYLAAKPRRRKG
jgi:2,4-dienoyl-CoA reductase-like NADH-dependent reductase (Old Yellow Enzyme family)/2-polyprenyl-6-methoxyphenol hydroxylase-like FAD-dependent oxidoreductase/REP element-mobilizing transposase RayT